MFLNILVLTLFFTSYAILHSLLASLAVKKRLRQRFSPGVDQWYRLFYNVVAVITLLPLFLLLAFLPDQLLYVVAAPWRWLLVTGQLLALVGLGLAFLQTNPLHFMGLAQLWTGDRQQNSQLVVTGFYYWMRHPLYFFSLLLLWLSPAMTLNLLIVYVMITLYFYIGSIYEERRLVIEFGPSYRAYQRCVPRMIPWRGRCYKPQPHMEAL